MQEYQDNYAKVKEEWKEKARTWDYKERYEALGLSGWSDSVLTLNYYDRQYLIDPTTGEITRRDDPGAAIDFNTTMNIYHLFYYSTKTPGFPASGYPFGMCQGRGCSPRLFSSRR